MKEASVGAEELSCEICDDANLLVQDTSIFLFAHKFHFILFETDIRTS